MKNKFADLEKAQRTEKNSKVVLRILAMLMIFRDNHTVEFTATKFPYRKGWVYHWMNRYEVEGIHGLYDRPKSGRSRKVSSKAIISIISKAKKNSLTPVVLQQKILKTAKVNYHITHVRKIMHEHKLSAIAKR